MSRGPQIMPSRAWSRITVFVQIFNFSLNFAQVMMGVGFANRQTFTDFQMRRSIHVSHNVIQSVTACLLPPTLALIQISISQGLHSDACVTVKIQCQHDL